MDAILELLVAICEMYEGIFGNSNAKGDISKGKKTFLITFLIIMFLGILACFVVGIIFLVGGSGDLKFGVGIGLIGLAGVGLLANIILLVNGAKKNKKIAEQSSKEDVEYKENNNSLLK